MPAQTNNKRTAGGRRDKSTELDDYVEREGSGLDWELKTRREGVGWNASASTSTTRDAVRWHRIS